jgi:peptidoglycan/LPS O-acetylase OafA/YrhL
MGVREHSFAAALAVFATYTLNQVAAGRLSILSVIIAAVLLSNVRATYLASKWTPAAEDEDAPTRFNESLRDKLVDQLPSTLWPVLKIPFFIAASVVVFVLIAGSFTGITKRPPTSSIDENSVPSELVVAPPDSH